MKSLHNAAALVGQPVRFTSTNAQPLQLETVAQTSPSISLYRLKQVLTRIPISRSAWFAGVKSGRYPRSYSLGPRTTVWRLDDINKVVSVLCE